MPLHRDSLFALVTSTWLGVPKLPGQTCLPPATNNHVYPQYNLSKRCFLCSFFVSANRNLFICSILRSIFYKTNFLVAAKGEAQGRAG